MAKIRVHELAKELGVDKREVLEYMKSLGNKLVTGVSALADQDADRIRAHFGQGTAAAENAQESSGGKSAADEAESFLSDAPKKKRGTFRVFRNQNAASPTKKAEEPKPAKEAEASAAPSKDAAEAKAGAVAEEAAKAEKPAEKPAAKAEEKAAEEKASSAAAPENKAAEPKAEKAAETAVSEDKAAEKPAETVTGQAVPTEKAEKKEAEESAPKAASEAKGEAEPKAPAKPVDRMKPEVRKAISQKPPIGQPIQGPRPQAAPNRTIIRHDRNSGNANDRTRAYSTSSQNARGGRDGRGTQGAFGRGGARTGSYGGGYAGRGGAGYQQGGRGPQGARGGFGPSGGGRQQFGAQGSFRGGKAQGGASDSSFMQRSSRDYSGGRAYDKTREERREMGRNQKDMSRLPKALQKKVNKHEPAKEKEVVTEIKLPERITVRDLADKMKVAPASLVKELFLKGMMVTVNHEITFDKAQEIALEHDIIAEPEEKEDVIGKLLAEAEEDEKDMVPRPPVVCVMGHVDHGKTSLLDAIRNTHVTDKEAGGITQHIGAYMVSVKGQKITFLDTPGHEAFTAMRMRGANSTDIAVLVVAADDGVMPQTVEAINHAKAANVTIIVAVNKIDKPGANVDRVRQELSEYGLVSEEWGGDTIFCPVSAKTQEGIDNLLEMILLTSEMLELKANPNRNARGLVLEAKLDKGRGPVATILVQKGTLRQGDFIACGAASGKVRAMTDEKGKRLSKALPSMPVEIIGLSSVPEAGEVLVALDSDREAKAFAATFVTEEKKNKLDQIKTQMSLEQLYEQIKEGDLKELPIVVKADVQGSVEAVKSSLEKLSNEEVVVKVIHGGVGAISESDVSLAAASNAIIIGFNVKADALAKNLAEQQNVDIHLYSVIYEAIDDVERALKGMRAAVYEEKVIGHAEIRMIFKSSSTGNIAGSYVKDGVMQRGCKVRVFRGEEKLYEGTLASLKRFKDDAKEVREGFECGLVFDGFGDFAEGDMVEAYTMVEVERD